MPRGILRTHCRVCERHVDECGKLSARGKCADCGNARLEANHWQLIEHRGPFFDHWRRRTLAAFGVKTPLDSDRDAA